MNTKTRKQVPPKNRCEKVAPNIYRRGDLSFQLKMMIGGKKIDLTFDSRAEAEAVRASKKAAAALDPDFKRVMENRVRKIEAAKSNLGWLLDKYLVEFTSKKKSAKTEAYRIGKLKRYSIAQTSIYTLGADDVTAFLTELGASGKVSPAGQRKYCSLISHVFTMAVKRWRLGVTNPIKEVEIPSAGKPRKRRLVDNEGEAILDSLDHDNTYAAAFVRLAIETSMRRGELLGLTWKDIDWAEPSAKLHDTKNGEARNVALSSLAIHVLSTLPRAHGDSDKKVLPIHPSALRGAWDRAKSKVGIKDLRIHDLRHEAISRLSAKGLTYAELQTMSGHKTVAMMAGYDHPRAADVAKKLG